MKRNIIAIVATVSAVLYGCNSQNSKEIASAEWADQSALSTDTTTVEKIIKTAEMRFRVKNARQTKIEISSHLQQLGGKLVESDLYSEIQKSERVKYSADSLLEITAYQTEGKIVARVPSNELDAFTDFVAQKADFVNHQSLKLDDQGLNYLSGKMKAGNKASAINSISQQKRKTSGQIDTSLVLKDQYVDQKINNMRINDQVKYSTITLSFYQHSTIAKTAVANDNLSDYGPGFLKQAGFNFTAGWVIFMEFILILINLWMFLLAAVVVYFSLAYYRRHRASLK